MKQNEQKYVEYFDHLQKLSRLGLIYHRYYKHPVLYRCAKSFGSRVLEVGSGIGNGILGTYPTKVTGVEINPLAVEFSRDLELNAELIQESGAFPFESGSFDSCLLDNVLEHIENPEQTLSECYRVVSARGGLVIVVPGRAGFAFDPDHKVFYDEAKLESLGHRWALKKMFAIPSLFRSEKLSKRLKQYCLVAIYNKN